MNMQKGTVVATVPLADRVALISRCGENLLIAPIYMMTVRYCYTKRLVTVSQLIDVLGISFFGHTLFK